MARRSELNSGDIYTIVGGAGVNPKLRAKVIQNGDRASLFLEYNLGALQYCKDNGEKGYQANRKKEFLKLYIELAPRTPMDKADNVNILEQAKQIRALREQEFLEDTEGYEVRKRRDGAELHNLFANYIANYKKQNINVVRASLSKFRMFLEEAPEYRRFTNRLPARNLDKKMVEAFAEYLSSSAKGSTPASYFKQFKKVIKHLTAEGVFRQNPCEGVIVKAGDETTQKAVLSLEEYRKLWQTPCDSAEVKRAFMFCLNTGIRFCDLVRLTFDSVDYSNRLIRFEQHKTEGRSSKSRLAIPLSDTALELIGEPRTGDVQGEKVFNLQSKYLCTKYLQSWVARAGITKHITWHCARHSFGTNMILGGASLKTTQELMGHSSVEITERYVRIANEEKRKAVSILPNLETLNSSE